MSSLQLCMKKSTHPTTTQATSIPMLQLAKRGCIFVLGTAV